MSTKGVSILILVLALLGISSGYLRQVQQHQKLGSPGVKIAAKPIYDPQGKIIGTNSVDLPEQIAGFKSELLPVTEIELNWLPKDTTYGRRHYRATGGFDANISVVVMGADRTSIHKPEYCLTGQGWLIEKTETRKISIDGPQPYDLPVKIMTLGRSYQTPEGQNIALKAVYIFWFVSEHDFTPEHGERMWLMAKSMVQHSVLERWAYISYFAQCNPGQEQTTFDRLSDFIKASVGEFQLAQGGITSVARK